MKSICRNDWKNTAFSQLCQNNTTNFSDGTLKHLHSPVTSKYTAITYINYYCAICNDDADDLMFWETDLECPGLKNDLEQTNSITENSVIEVVLDNDKLGIQFQIDGIQEYHACSSVPSFPKSGSSLLRKCLPAISKCVDQWSDIEVEKLCHSYTAVIYSHHATFKNIHCAICNNIDNDNLHCNPRASHSGEQIITASNPRAFALLFDFFDLYGSNVVGSHCNDNEIWDSIFKKCRKIICKNKSHKYRHGKCVKMNDESEYFTTPSTRDISPNKEMTDTSFIAAESNSSKNYSTSIPFIQSIVNDTHKIMITINNINNSLPNRKETDNGNSLIAKTRNILLSNHTTTAHVISNNTEKNIPQANKLIKRQGLNCSQILLTSDEFIVEKNNSIFVSKLQKGYSFAQYRKQGNDVLVCADDFISYKFSHFMGILTIAGLVMSCVCLVLHLIVFFSVSHLRNLAGKNLASLSATLLSSYFLFIVSMFSNANDIFCYIISIMLYYSFLSSFFWMNIISFDIWWTIYKTKYLLILDGKHSLRFIFYSLYSFGLPGVALVIAVALDNTQPSGFPTEFLPFFGKFWCWFGQRKSLLIFFAFPVIVLMSLNIVCFSWSIYIIKRTQQLSVNARSCSFYINQIKLYTSISVISGLTWITGIIAGCIQMEFVWYIFIFFNTIQGVLIFIVFTCKKSVWHSLRRGFVLG
ncbi:unnamed protein product [Meganyctiphanes norvegica]|uniref:G-protein coupled receptors family 2 profile 2 domain-containing protein n=1 Tax=Meganyctiphanes norvegica TaxID=48144 RepID=A0AAV2SLI4_MEGNR